MTSLSAATLRNISVGLVLASVATISSPADAANFFEQLFGGQAQVSAEQAPAEAAPSDFAPTAPARGALPPRHKRHVALNVEPVRQKTTDLMHDKTLQFGDAVVTKTGIEVYSGSKSGRHTSDQFVALNGADIPSQEKQQLAALDRATANPVAVEPLREGRSASDASSRIVSGAMPVTRGYKVTDATGKSVRYVGP